MAIANSVFELLVVGLASVFASALFSPENFLGKTYLAGALQQLGIPAEGRWALLAAAGGVSLAALALKGCLGLLKIYLDARFSDACFRTLASRAFESLLAHPFDWHIEQNPALLSKALTVDLASIQILLTVFLSVSGDLMIILLMVCALAWRMGALALSVLISLGGLGYIIYRRVHRSLIRHSQREYLLHNQATMVSTQAISGLKDTKVMGRESVLLAAFSAARLALEPLRAKSDLFRAAPRYIMELVGFSGLMLAMGVMSLSGLSAERVSENFTLLAVGFLRLLPAINRLLTNLAQMSSHLAPARNALAVLQPGPRVSQGLLRGAVVRSIELRGVSYTYPGARQPSLEGVDLRIDAPIRVALVGRSGAGKTTLADLLCGLLSPEKGGVWVNGVSVSSLFEAHPGRVGYVLQSPFLLDGTIAENVAFSLSQVDTERVWDCLRMAQLAAFVEELEGGLEARVGDRGVRLSGGQAQRLAIARSLYPDPDVLILDEATSALDGITEAAFIETLEALTDKIVIVVAHRLSSIRACDRVLLLEAGQVIAAGAYNDLIAESPEFRELTLQETENSDS